MAQISSLQRALLNYDRGIVTGGTNVKAGPSGIMSPKPPPRKLSRYESPIRTVPLPSHLDNMFLDLPLDLLVEITTYLRPLDLIRLSRVDKTIRALLMRRSARCIWRATLRAVNALPPSPIDIPEPLLAALLFLVECTLCGGYTDENIDFALRVKPCLGCRKTDIISVSRVDFAKYLFVSTSKAASSSLKSCLRGNYEEIKSKYEELKASEDTRALKCWTQERQKSVEERSKNTALLSKWFKAWSKKRQVKQHLPLKERKRLTRARVADIEDRMMGMGYQLSEIRHLRVLEPRKWRKWIAESGPLDDQAWELLIPHLLHYLEICRKRLRRSERQPTLNKILLDIQNRLQPIRCIQPQLDVEEWALLSPPDDGSPALESNNKDASLTDNDIILPSFPHSCDALLICPEVEAIVDAPTPRETFELEIRAAEGNIEPAAKAWRDVLEHTLLNLLPMDTQPAEVETSEYKLVLGTGRHIRPLDLLSLGHKKLLRADSIFCLGNTSQYSFSNIPLYYPEAFQGNFKLSEKVTLCYHSVAAKIAGALLRAIGVPDVSYLAMSLMPRLYQCGRCDNDHPCYTWRQLLQHYLDEAAQEKKSAWWVLESAQDSCSHISIHDVDSVYPGKPLLKLVDPIMSNQDHFLCLLCLQANTPADTYLGGENIQHYFQNVHLVDEPMEGVHYILTSAPDLHFKLQ